MPLDQEKARRMAADRIKKSGGHCDEWAAQARDDFAFVAGDQWEEADKAKLANQKRPIVVFNYSEKMVDAVVGSEVNNRQEATYRPRNMASDQLTEMMNYGAKWVRDECMAEDEETDAFRDALICGMGWIENKMDYSEDPNGMMVESRSDPTEWRWDTAATKPGLADRRWDAHGEWVDNDLIAVRWPDADTYAGGDGTDGEGALRHIQQGNRYNKDNDSTGQDKDDRRVDQTLVWSYQCCENEPVYRVDNGQGGIEDVPEELFRKIKKKLDEVGLKYVRSWKKVYYHMFITGDDYGRVLQFGPSPYQQGFTRQCITGKRDRNQNMWYGLTRVMKDPQRWANKWLSQIMYIINSNAKGGLLAEINALQNPADAQEDWASADKVVLLKEGGINKIKERTMAAYPSGLAQLMQFALNSLPQVTGINLEALGLADRDQANVLEQSRKQAAYGLLAPIFDSLRRFRKNQARITWSFIQQFVADGRLIRIAGPDVDPKTVQLVRVPDSFEYDVVVDQSPSAPDVKSQTWQALMQLVPAMLKAGMPLPPTLLAYAPIPTALAQQWMQFLQQQQQNAIPPQIQQQMQQLQQDLQQLTQENQQLKLDNTDKQIMAQQKAKESDAEIQRKNWEVQQSIALKEMETKAALMLKGIEVDGKAELDKAHFSAEQQRADKQTEHSLQMADKQTSGNLRIKAAQSGVKAGKDGEVRMKMDNSEVVDALKNVTESFSGALDKIVANMNRPKKIVRDKKTGAVTGVE